MTKEEIITDIRSYFGFTVFSGYSNYYVGITNDINRRLFDEHNVSAQKDYWIYRTADSKSVAQKVEEYFLIVIELQVLLLSNVMILKNKNTTLRTQRLLSEG